MAVVLLGNIARKTSAGYFSEGNTRTYKDMLLENIAAARTLFALPFDPSRAGPTPLSMSRPDIQQSSTSQSGSSQSGSSQSNSSQSNSSQSTPSEGAQ
jgi:hypothetical protein